MSVVLPDLCSLFSPKVNLKQGLQSDPKGYAFASIRTMSLVDRNATLGTRRGGCFSLLVAEVFWEDLLCEYCVKIHVKSEFLSASIRP